MTPGKRAKKSYFALGTYVINGKNHAFSSKKWLSKKKSENLKVKLEDRLCGSHRKP